MKNILVHFLKMDKEMYVQNSKVEENLFRKNTIFRFHSIMQQNSLLAQNICY